MIDEARDEDPYAPRRVRQDRPMHGDGLVAVGLGNAQGEVGADGLAQQEGIYSGNHHARSVSVDRAISNSINHRPTGPWSTVEPRAVWPRRGFRTTSGSGRGRGWP